MDMIDEFASTIDSWTNFYMLAGSAAFVLLGLVFVAVSINIDIIGETTQNRDLNAFSSQIYLNFLAIAIISLVFVIPKQTPHGLGIALLLIGSIETFRTARLWRKFEFGYKGQRNLNVNQFRRRLLIPNSICYLTLIFISLSVINGNTRYLDWMTMVVIWLLISGSLSSWVLLLRLASFKSSQ